MRVPRWRWPVLGALLAAGMLIAPVSAGSVVSDSVHVRPVPRPSVPRSPARAATVPLPKTSLQSAWQQMVHENPLLQQAAVSAYAYDLTTHRALAALNPQQEQIPASVTKMFTTAAALAQLGPNFSYVTRAEASAASLAGTPGPIYLVGGGDPWLEANGTHGLEQLAAEVAKRVHLATQVVGVSTLFTSSGIGPGWSGTELPASFSAATSALGAERSEVEVVVAGGSAPGAPVRVSLSFDGAVRVPGFFSIENEATTVASHAAGAQITRLLGGNTILVQGSVAPQSVTGTYLSVHDPALFAAALFQQALVQDGVRFSSAPSTGTLPQGMELLAVHQSPRLSALLQTQNRYSVNLMADNLYFMLGAARSGVGSPATAAAAMAAFVKASGIGPQPLQADGSGLSPLNLRSAQDVVRMLAYAASEPWFSAFEQSMMQAGNPNPKVCGVICGHFVGTPAAGRVWLKTGNLENQWNYVGYATAANGDQIAFAILAEGPLTKQLDGYQGPIDQMTEDLAVYPNLKVSAQGAQAQATAPMPPLAALANLPAAPGAVTGGAVIDLQSGQVVWQQNGQTLIRTAWVPRLALLDAALASSSSGFPPVTVQALGPVQGGTLAGPILLDGSLDPGITQVDLAALAQAVQAAGIRSVTGPVEYAQGPVGSKGVLRWPNGAVYEALGQGYLPPASRLLVGGDAVTLTLRATAPGARAQYQVTPQDAPITIVNQAVGASGGPASATATWQRGTDAYILAGQVPVGTTVRLQIAPPDPGRLGAILFRDALRAAGVQVASDAVAAAPPDGQATVLASLPGSSLAQLASPMLTQSSSAIAAQVGLLLGTGATKAIAAAAGPEDILPDPTGTAMNDYMTPLSVAQLLARAYGAPKEQPLVRALGKGGLWRVDAPGTQAFVGYTSGPSGTPYAVVVLRSGLPAGSSYAPVITPPAFAN